VPLRPTHIHTPHIPIRPTHVLTPISLELEHISKRQRHISKRLYSTYPNANTAHIQTPIGFELQPWCMYLFRIPWISGKILYESEGNKCARATRPDVWYTCDVLHVWCTCDVLHVWYTSVCHCYGIHVMYCMCGIRLYAIAMVYMWCIACVVYICMPLQVKDLTDRRMSTSEKTWQMQGCLDLTHASVSTLHTTWHMQAYLQCTWLDTCKRVQTWHRQPCHRCNHVYTRKRQACHVKATKSTVDAMPWWRMQRVHLVSIGDQGHI